MRDKSAVTGETRINEQEAARHRIQIDLSPEAFRRLQALKLRAEAQTNAEVVRSALWVYEWFLEQRHKGCKIQVVDNEMVREVEFIL